MNRWNLLVVYWICQREWLTGRCLMLADAASAKIAAVLVTRPCKFCPRGAGRITLTIKLTRTRWPVVGVTGRAAYLRPLACQGGEKMSEDPYRRVAGLYDRLFEPMSCWGFS